MTENAHHSTNEFRVFGPPGCGKTTTLSRLIAGACQSYGSEAVLVSSFTRAAARELVGRELPLDESRIGTLHALCYRALERPKLVSRGHLQDWNQTYPTRAFGGIQTDVDDPYGLMESDGTQDGDRLLQELNRLRGLQVDPDAWPVRIQSFAEDWTDFKAMTGTIDFTDLIAQCLQDRLPIPHGASVLFLDEVQDFSPLELALARHWGSQCERFYLAGDDDQCLYRFKGSTPDAFLSPALPAEQVQVLGQSYRVPRAVHAAASAWIESVEQRHPKTYRPKPVDGLVDTLPLNYRYPCVIQDQLDEWLAAGKTVAFLASCSFFLDKLKHQLRDWGIPFHNPYRRSRGDWNPLSVKAGTVSAADRVVAFTQPARGQWWTYASLWRWVQPLDGDRILTHGAKTSIRRKAESDETAGKPVDVADLESWFTDARFADAAGAGNLAAYRDAGFIGSYERAMSYALAIGEQRGVEALTTTPQVILGTIHSVKGGEADIVVLFPDLSPSGYQEWSTPGEPHDAVRRCFYVGMTRAKEALYWAQPSGASIGGYL